jgi:hypothetical protein
MARFPRRAPVALTLALLLSAALPALAAGRDPPKPCKDKPLELTQNGEVAVNCDDLWPLKPAQEGCPVTLNNQQSSLKEIKQKLEAGVKITADLVEWKGRPLKDKTLLTTQITAHTE